MYRLKEISRNSKIPFGGINVCVIGDMTQLDPVGPRIYKNALHLYQFTNVTSLNFIGSALFITFIRKELTQQMRAADDPRHQRIIEKLRNLSNEFPIDDEIIDILYNESQLSPQVVINDPEFRNAKMCISSNLEKLSFENLLLKQFAIQNNVPIIKWENKLSTKLPDAVKDILFGDYHSKNSQIDFLYQTFVQGSNCICTENINILRGMCNGTPIIQHSLVMETKLEMDALNNLLQNSYPGQVILLSNRPKYVNVIIPDHIYSYWNNNKLSILDTNTNQRYIPFDIGRQDHSRSFNGIAEISKIYYREFPYQYNFVNTEYKVQGQTLNRIISVLRPTPSNSFKPLVINGFMVRLSRVRRLDHHKILPVGSRDELLYLKKLSYSPDLKRFLEAYNDDGVWIDPITPEEKRITMLKISNNALFQQIKEKKKNLDNITVDKSIVKNNNSNLKQFTQVQSVKEKSFISKNIKKPITKFVKKLFKSPSSNKRKNEFEELIVDNFLPINNVITLSISNFSNYGLFNNSNWCYFNSAIQMIFNDDYIIMFLKHINNNLININNVVPDADLLRINQFEFLNQLYNLFIFINNDKNNNNMVEKENINNNLRESFHNLYSNLELSNQNDFYEYYLYCFDSISSFSIFCSQQLVVDFNGLNLNNYELTTCTFYAPQCLQCKSNNLFSKDFDIDDVVHYAYFIKDVFPTNFKNNNLIPLTLALKQFQSYYFIDKVDVLYDNQINCNNCNINCNFKINQPFRVKKYPNRLIITVECKTTNFNNNILASNFINFPLEFNYSELKLLDDVTQSFIENYNIEFESKKNDIYSLVSFVEHIGGLINSGHYKSYIRDKVYNVWYCFNDNVVSILSKDQITSLLSKPNENGIYFATYEINISCIINKNNNIININYDCNDNTSMINTKRVSKTTKFLEDYVYNAVRKVRKVDKNPYLDIDNTNYNSKLNVIEEKINNNMINNNLLAVIDLVNDANNDLILLPFPLTYYNFMNLIPNDVINISTDLNSSIDNSSNNLNLYENTNLPRNVRDQNDINWSDLFRIKSSNWLSGGIINCINRFQMDKYKNINNMCLSNNELLPFYIFSSYEIPDMENEFIAQINSIGHRIIRQFKCNIFSGIKSHLFFPINHGNTHWTLVVVGIIEKKIYFLDSFYHLNVVLSINRSIQIFRKTKCYLLAYANNMNIIDFDSNSFEEIHLKDRVAQQTNGYDCGVFGLTYIDSLLNNNYLFSQTNMPLIRKNILAFIILGKMFKTSI